MALELLKVLMENSGPSYRQGEKYLTAIRQYLCVSLLKNSSSSTTQVMQLTSSIFLTLLFKFRSSLKAEVREGGRGVREGRLREGGWEGCVLVESVSVCNSATLFSYPHSDPIHRLEYSCP